MGSLSLIHIFEQEFISPKDFDFATINFSDHENQISGKTFISVLDKTSSEIIYYKEVENSEIHYGCLLYTSCLCQGGGVTD